MGKGKLLPFVGAVVAVSLIPRRIHQIWHDFGAMPEPPVQMLQWRHSWEAHHPEWKHTLWGVAESRALVAQHYPWFLATYDGFSLNIERYLQTLTPGKPLS
jgi:mannosyltransferase OCH1-like enzyme